MMNLTSAAQPGAAESVIIDQERLVRFADAIVRALGSTPEEAAIVARHLVDSNLAGHDSHGIGMLPTYVANAQAGHLKPNQALTPVIDGPVIGVYEAHAGFGQVMAPQVIRRGMEKARKSGLAAVHLRNAHHIGRIGTYGSEAAAGGFVSLHFVNVVGHRPLVAAFGGIEPRFATNPICIAIPDLPDHPGLLLDMATSETALGKVRVARNRGVPMPAGALIDSEGHPTTDPRVMFDDPQGAQLPFGKHKGSGLAMMCELLAGALAGAQTIQPENDRSGRIINNMLTFILDPGAFGDRDGFLTECAAMVRYAKASRAQPGIDKVRVAGDPERESAATRRVSGIPIDPTTWADLRAAALSAGVPRTDLADLPD